MKRLGLITLTAAALVFGLVIASPSSAEACWRNGSHHQGQYMSRQSNYQSAYNQDRYYRADNQRPQCPGWNNADWDNHRGRNQNYNRPHNGPHSNYCPYY